MTFKNQTHFTAKINNVDVFSIRSMINYKIDTLEDRMKCVEIALKHGDIFYQEYFSKYCNTNLSTDDMLLSESNVVQSLEAMANYILAKDPEYNKTDNSYFANENELIRKSKREDEFNGTSASIIDGLELEKGNVEVKNESNFKKLKKQKITQSDLKRNDELGSVLRDYNTFLDLISKHTKTKGKSPDEVKKMKLKKKVDLHVYTRHHSNIKDDMLICKDSMMKIHGYNLKNFSESTQPDYSVIDLTNVNHLLGGWVQYTNGKVMSNGLLSFKATDDYQDDFNCIIVDMENLIKQCDLSEFQLEVLELYQNGLTAKAIADEFEVHNMKIERTLKSIAKKVSEKATEQYKGRGYD